MTPPRIRALVPVVALEPARAAEALDVGETFFRSEVLPDIKVIRRGSKVLVPLTELQRWVDENAARTLGGGA